MHVYKIDAGLLKEHYSEVPELKEPGLMAWLQYI
jgi:hypothetical protein